MLKMKLMVSLLLIVLTTALIGGLTGAWFTDTESAGTATFTAGRLDIDVPDGLSDFNLLLDYGSKHGRMNPGDLYDPITIQIRNTGTKNVAWFGDWIFTPTVEGADKLLDKMYIETMSMSFIDIDGNPWNADPWYSGYDFIVNGKGNFVGHNQGEADFFDGLAAMSPDGVITLRNWNDNANMAPGSTFEHMGALKPGENRYVLKVVLGFHKSAGNEYQGDAEGVSPITIGFNINATQINAEAMDALFPGLGIHFDWMNDQINVQP